MYRFAGVKCHTEVTQTIEFYEKSRNRLPLPHGRTGRRISQYSARVNVSLNVQFSNYQYFLFSLQAADEL